MEAEFGLDDLGGTNVALVDGWGKRGWGLWSRGWIEGEGEGDGLLGVLVEDLFQLGGQGGEAGFEGGDLGRGWGEGVELGFSASGLFTQEGEPHCCV